MLNLLDFIGEGAHNGQSCALWAVPAWGWPGVRVGEGRWLQVSEAAIRFAGKATAPVNVEFDAELRLSGPGKVVYTFRKPFTLEIEARYQVEGGQLKTAFEYQGNVVEINYWRHNGNETGIWIKSSRFLPLGARFHIAPQTDGTAMFREEQA